MDFLSLAKNGKNDWWRISFFITAIAVSVAIATFVTDSVDFTIGDELTTDNFIEGIAFLIVLIGVFISIRVIHKRSFASLNGPFRRNEFFEGILVWGILVIAGSLINNQTNWKYFFDNLPGFSLAILLPVMMISIAIQSYTEEVVFRGYLFQTLSLSVKNLNLLIVICSSIFGILHFGDGLAAVIAVAIFGCLNCYIVIKRNNLSFVTGVHFINNFFFVYVLARGSTVENDNFLRFDFVEYTILLIQFVLLVLYTRYRNVKVADNKKSYQIG